MEFVVFEIIIVGLVFLSVSTFFLFMLPWYSENIKREKREESLMNEYDLVRKQSFLGKIRPFLQFVVRMDQGIRFVNRWVENSHAKWETKLDKAGNPGNVTGKEFLALKQVSAVFMVLVMAFGFGLPVSMLYFFLFVFGFFLPDMWLNDRIRSRLTLISKALPDALDSFALVVGAGLSFGEAMDVYVNRSTKNPLTEEFSIVRNEERLGRTQIEALQSMSERVGSVSLTNFTTMVIQSTRMGTTLADVLDAQAADLRGRRFHLAEEMGQKAPIKMVFPLLLFVMPNVFIILFAPMALKLLYHQ